MQTEKKYKLGKTLGRGTFGLVKVATHIKSGIQYAVKILEKNKIKTQTDIERIKREIRILKLLDHPNLIKLHDLVETQNEVYLVMDLCEGGELFEFINKETRVDEDTAKRIYSQIIDAIEYLGTVRICHRDLKPENILLDKNMNIKIVDFGLSNTWNPGERLQTACGTPCYASPEMISSKSYQGTQTDIWSSGILLYFMVCGHLPFEEKDTESLYMKILNANCLISSILPSYLSEECKSLIQKILNVDVRRRYGIRQIRNHPWFKEKEYIDDLPKISIEDLTINKNNKVKIKITEGDDSNTPKVFINNLNQSIKNALDIINSSAYEDNFSKSVQGTPKICNEYSDFSSVNIESKQENILSKLNRPKRTKKLSNSNNSSLVAPRVPKQKIISSKSKLPQISINSKCSQSISINPIEKKSIAFSPQNITLSNVPKLSNRSINCNLNKKKRFRQSKRNY